SGAVRVGVESSGNMLWFERLLARLKQELWIGDAAAIHWQNPRKLQLSDPRDARHLLNLLLENRFPRLWVPSMEELDLQQVLEDLDRQVKQMNQEAEKAAAARKDAQLLMSHPGVGPILALATVLTLGDVSRFPCGRQVASYIGLVPTEMSSGQHRWLGSITKQGNSFMRFLLVQAGLSAARGDAELGRVYKRLVQKKHHGVAKVAVARKLLVRLYWMLRTQKQYPEVVRMQGSLSHPVA